MSIQNTVDKAQKLAAETQLLALCQAEQAGWQVELVSWLNIDNQWLRRRCAHRLGNVADAEDAVQEISLKVMRAIGQFEGRSMLRTWVTRIADNHCNTLIKRRRANAITDHLQHSITVFEEARYEAADQEHEQSSIATAVQTTLQCLSEKNQQILRLRFDNDLSLDDMAGALNLSLSATKMRLYRAMDAFKKKTVLDRL